MEAVALEGSVKRVERITTAKVQQSMTTLPNAVERVKQSKQAQQALEAHVPVWYYVLSMSAKTLATIAAVYFWKKNTVRLILALVFSDIVFFACLIFFKLIGTDYVPSRSRSGAVVTRVSTTSYVAQSITMAEAPAVSVSNDIHIAGSCTRKHPTEQGPPRPKVDIMAWQDAVASKFKLRVGPNYKKNSNKAPSGESLYELIGIDVFRCAKERLRNVGSNPRFVLPSYRELKDPPMEDIRSAGVPRLFIVNAQIPDKPPAVFGKNKDDPGFSLIFYFTVKSAVIDQLKNGVETSSPAAKLLHKYINEHSTCPDIRRRFKAIGMADLKDSGIPGVGPIVESFNGKPAIINKVAEIYSSGDDMDWFEVDISVFDFPFVAQRALTALKDRVNEIGLRAGFVLQGETDDELPETLLGGGEFVSSISHYHHTYSQTNNNILTRSVY